MESESQPARSGEKSTDRLADLILLITHQYRNRGVDLDHLPLPVPLAPLEEMPIPFKILLRAMP